MSQYDLDIWVDEVSLSGPHRPCLFRVTTTTVGRNVVSAALRELARQLSEYADQQERFE